ncbi:MAG: TolC family protein [Endomicrobia bacterium]|nr:TolC family protein [Endomicrobiia bacterium]
MKKVLCLAFLISLPLNAFAEQGQLTLGQAIDTALKNNPAIKAAMETASGFAHGASAAKSAYLPRIDVTALASKINEPITLDLNDVRSAIISASVASNAGATPGLAGALDASLPSFEKKMLDDTFVRVMATFVQPIFTGFKASANTEVKKLRKDAAEINLDNAKNSVITSVVEDYYRLMLARQTADIRAELQASLENHVENAQKLYDHGIISKSNLLRAEVALADAKRDYQKALMDAELAAILLSSALGAAANQDFDLAGPMEMLPGQQDPSFYVSKAESRNSSLKLLEIEKKMLRQKYRAAAGNLLPNIAAVGEYQILQDKLTMFEPEWALGLTASINVFSGGSDINEMKAAKSEIAAAQERENDVRNLVRTAVQKYLHQCESAKKDYEALASGADLAKENLKLSEASFREGLATSLEVVDAELAATRIKIEKAKAIFDYNSAYANLLAICSLSQNLANVSEESK